MINAVCPLSVAPIRAEASDRSEMVSQLLFGETCAITDDNEKWYKVFTTYDNYTGWVDKKQVQLYAESKGDTSLTIERDNAYIAHTRLGAVPLYCGSNIVHNEGLYYLGDESITVPNLSAFPNILKLQAMLQTAISYINTPYLWGGRTRAGIDCSGFVQLLFKLMQVVLPRDASQQVEKGVPISIDDTKSGDLAFFNNAEGRVVHVGLMLNNTRIIHASGRVRIDTLDSKGIYNIENNTHSHTLHSIKRILV